MERRRLDLLFVTTVTLLLAAQPLGASERFRFHYQPPGVGEHTSNKVHFVLDLLSGTHQGGVPIGAYERQMHRTSQQRLTTVLAAPKGLPTKVQIEYPAAEQGTRIGLEEERRAAAPVVGKTYVAERVGEEVRVSDSQGRTPSPEEVDIVRRHMSGLGRPNPLGQFLDGRVIAVGETFRLPDELASEFLGLVAAAGEGSLAELTLLRVRHVEGASLATFDARIAGQSHVDGAMDLLLDGRLILNADTCAIAALNLFGPASISQRQGSAEAASTLTASGTLQVSVRRDSGRTLRR